MKFISLVAFFVTAIAMKVSAQDAERKIAYNNYQKYWLQAGKVKDVRKEASIQEFRTYFFKSPYRYGELKKIIKTNAREYFSLLNGEGQFSDLLQQEKKIMDEKMLSSNGSKQSNAVADLTTIAFMRLWDIADAVRKGEMKEQEVLIDNYFKAIIRYGAIETGRSNESPRFHASCFAIPTAAVNTYFAMLNRMDQVESGQNKSPLLKEACDMLKVVALQCWTQPFRNDFTDQNVVQIERFRNHVWWVGGNALAYRSLLPVAFMYKSIPMLDLLADVCQKGISTTSQNTFDTSFWTEGFTKDGAGWGHGKQSLVWGYPIDGTSNALAMLNILKDSPWSKQLSKENTAALMNFFRGSNWYYYKGHSLPSLDRYSMKYDLEGGPIRYAGMLSTLLNDWKDSFTAEELAELKELAKEVKKNNINMDAFGNGVYTGTRWFFNNDDLIKKNENYSILVNMASNRCDGLESATNMADEYNFFTADGTTLFQRSGTEYRSVFGGWDVTATPGVTAREGMQNITPVTNWRGYNSKFNFAGAATSGNENAVAGFVFEKMNASERDDVNDKGTNIGKNLTIYGVAAHKSYFMLGDYFVALGAGVTNLKPELDGSIRTTIDQTLKENEVEIISKGGGKAAVEGGKAQSFLKNGKPVWVSQSQKFAYTILPEYSKNAWFVCETKKTNWVKMNKTNEPVSNLPSTVNMLRLWIDHGQKVNNGTYGYVVYTGKGKPKDQLPFTVLRNDTVIQAIASNDAKITEAVFYQPNSQLKTKNISLSASAACIVLVEEKANEQIISVNDPQMDKTLTKIELNLNGKTISVDMPQGELGGKPAVIHIKK